MMFLANENFPYPSIKLLRDKGLHVLSICEEFGGISDDKVLQMASQQNRIILTFDRDYGELIFKYCRQSPPSVIYFRSKGTNPLFAGLQLWEIIQNQTIQIEGYFTVIEDTGIRQRKL